MRYVRPATPLRSAHTISLSPPWRLLPRLKAGNFITRTPRRWGSTKRRLYLSYMDCPCALDITDSPSVIVFTYADITDMPFASGEPEEIYITIG